MRLLLALVLLTGCHGAYHAAAGQDTVEAYRRFLAENPEDGQAIQARERLAELEFEAATKLHTIVGYKRFLDEFGKSPEAQLALARLEGLRFNAAKQDGSVPALRAFIADHPEGAHRAEAEALLEEVQLRGLVKDPAGLVAVGQAQRSDPRAFEAAAKLDDLAFESATKKGAEALLAYLREFVAGAHREQVKTRLLELELEGLMASGLLDEAALAAARSPLSKELSGFRERLLSAQAEAALRASEDPQLKVAFPGYYLRSLADLTISLKAADALDRWQAAEELGQHVSIRAIDPLLWAIREDRNWLVRQRAFDALATVLRALPQHVVDYELATRLEALRAKAGDGNTHLAIATLLDLSGRIEEAAAQYQKAFDRDAPDPLVLHRWAKIRQERAEHFSAAVAARQLALWATQTAKLELPEAAAAALGPARQLCAAAVASNFALEVLQRAKKEKTEFPEDLVEFEAVARQAKQLADARLKDAELLVRTADAHESLCGDRQVSDRLAEAELARINALKSTVKKRHKLSKRLLELSARSDPSAAVRAEALELSKSASR